MRTETMGVVLLALLAVVTAVLGGLVARQFYAQDATAPGGQAPSEPGSTSSGQGSPPVGDGSVLMLPDADHHPLHDQVQAALQNYVDAINDQDYARWRETVSQRLAVQMPEAKWRDAMSTTRDSDIRVYRINTTTSEVYAIFTFTSHQSIDRAPPEAPSTCDHWWVVYPMVWRQDSLLIDAGTANLSPQVIACGG